MTDAVRHPVIDANSSAPGRVMCRLQMQCENPSGRPSINWNLSEMFRLNPPDLSATGARPKISRLTKFAEGINSSRPCRGRRTDRAGPRLEAIRKAPHAKSATITNNAIVPQCRRRASRSQAAISDVSDMLLPVRRDVDLLGNQQSPL
jgi:hypothetical protein